MRVLSSRVHGVLDYLMGILLIATPWLFGFAQGGPETYIPVVLGCAVILYSLCTNYELGVFKLISMKGHLTLDFISGLFLAASPWIFGFNDVVYLPHLILGIAEIGASLMTQTVAYTHEDIDIGYHHRHRHAH
jgi:hypothetical protein